MIRVLFVCLGNICRSPMAEAIFRHEVKKAGLDDQIEVDSAGTSNWHIGKVPHEGTREILDEHAISYDGMTARQFQQEDGAIFDYVIVMDESNKENAKSISEAMSDEQLFLLTDFLPDREDTFVPDPYYTGDFQYTYELVIEGCERILEHIQHKQSSK